MSTSESPRLRISEDLRAFALDCLRQLVEPDAHLLGCPDAVVVSGDALAGTPDADGVVPWTIPLSIQCGHGCVSNRVVVDAFGASPSDPEGQGS